MVRDFFSKIRIKKHDKKFKRKLEKADTLVVDYFPLVYKSKSRQRIAKAFDDTFNAFANRFFLEEFEKEDFRKEVNERAKAIANERKIKKFNNNKIK